MRIAVIGSGYVGLVAGACFAELGHDVILVDNDPAKYEALQRGEVPIHEEHLPELLAKHRDTRLASLSVPKRPGGLASRAQGPQALVPLEISWMLGQSRSLDVFGRRRENPLDDRQRSRNDGWNQHVPSPNEEI